MPITPKILDRLLKDHETAEVLSHENRLRRSVTKDFVERALSDNLTHHPGECRRTVEKVSVLFRKKSSFDTCILRLEQMK